MDLRKDFGGKIETLLNAAVDKYVNPETLAAMILPQLVDLIKTQSENLKHQLKAEVIDLIDGEDDIA